MKSRREFLMRAGAMTALSVPAWAQAERWPQRAVKVICPYAPGGGSDVTLRVLTQRLSESLGQPFVVENKPGAGTRIGYEAAAKAPPDGYTALYCAATYATVEGLYGKLAYDPRRDLQPVIHVGDVPLFLIVNAASPHRSVADLVKAGQARSQGLTFATPAAGSVPHLACEMFMREAKVPGLSVHFKGDSASFTELLGGRVDATFTTITGALPHIEAGKLRVLATATPQRNATYPAAVTMREASYPQVVGSAWYGFMLPAGVPAAVVERFNAEVNALLKDAALQARLLSLGLEVRGGSPTQFADFIAEETDKWTRLIRAAGVTGG